MRNLIFAVCALSGLAACSAHPGVTVDGAMEQHIKIDAPNLGIEDYITNTYKSILGRAPTQQELTDTMQELTKGLITPAQLEATLKQMAAILSYLPV